MPTFGSPFPMHVPPRDDAEEAEISMQVEAAPGEVALDAIIRAQATAPQIAKRLRRIENCLWALANYLEQRGVDDQGRDLVQEARELLKSRLEIANTRRSDADKQE